MSAERDIVKELRDCGAATTIASLRAENERLKAATPKMFPLQISRHPEVTKPGPVSIPWEIAEFAYAAYSQKYGRGQTLERLAERGGFSWGEMDMLYPSWRVEANAFTRLRKELESARTLLAAAQAECEAWREFKRHAISPTGDPFEDRYADAKDAAMRAMEAHDAARRKVQG
jgi:hypothetical protein